MFAFAILGLAFGTFIIIFIVTQDLESIDLNKALSNVSTTITINLVIWLGFIKWAWKWKIFYPWLVPFPNLSGEWKGHIKSNRKEKNSILTDISITQTFFHIQIKVKTSESSSYSIASSFDIDKDRGLQQLFYSYLNTPRSGVRNRSEIHYGSARLNFNGFKVNEIEGEYWTTRETTGEIKIRKISTDTYK